MNGKKIVVLVIAKPASSGSSVRSHVTNDNYRNNFDDVFKKKDSPTIH